MKPVGGNAMFAIQNGIRLKPRENARDALRFLNIRSASNEKEVADK